MKYPPIFNFWPSYRLELIALAVFLISHYASEFYLLALLAPMKINSNMCVTFVTILASIGSTASPCVTYLPLYVFHCAKIYSVQTQWTQGKKRIVGARLYSPNGRFLVQRRVIASILFINPRKMFENNGLQRMEILWF